MDFAFSASALHWQTRVREFMERHVVPQVAAWQRSVDAGIFPPPFIEELKARAKAEGLWNLFLPTLGAHEPGNALSNLDYAPLAELMGRVPWAAEVFNCNAPDSGNMELLHLFASPQQRKDWLEPLLSGQIRSAFAMTEPGVASSDATNIATRISRDGQYFIITGRKWFISNAADPRCELAIVMGVSRPDAESHARHSMVLVPMKTPGLKILRNIPIMSHYSPEGHCEIIFDNVRVPIHNLLGEEGAGFSMAQARLGPGRIHHCMRSIGQCELAFELMCDRALERRAFGERLSDRDSIREWIGLSRCEIDQARLLVLKTAWLIDNLGAKAARKEIAMIKVVVPRLQTTVVDRAMQVFGAAGLTPDTPLAYLWTWGRALRFIDGPDEVHLGTIAKMQLRSAADATTRSDRYMTPPDCTGASTQ